MEQEIQALLYLLLSQEPPQQHTDPPLNSRSLLKFDSAHIAEFNSFSALCLKSDKVLRADFTDYVVQTLLLALMAFVAQKAVFADGLYGLEKCVILNVGRAVFREAVRALLPLQLETLSEKLLNATAEKAPPREGAYLCWLSVIAEPEWMFCFLKGQFDQYWQFASSPSQQAHQNGNNPEEMKTLSFFGSWILRAREMQYKTRHD